MLNFEQIKKIIPQRFPMILIDKVTKYEKGKSLVAIKNVSGNESYFLGHFPKNAVMPGNLITEAVAQAAIVLYHVSKNKDKSTPMYLLGSTKASFYHPVVPGDQLKIETIAKRLLSTAGYISTKVFVDSRLVAEADIVFKVKR